MSRIVIAGGAGFLGSHLCDRLVDRGDHVVCIDNLITGRRSNVAHLDANESFEFIEHDISKPIEIDGDIDAIFHLASPASPVDFERIPIQILKAGSLGSHNLLGLALQKQARFLLASTSEVYGDPLVHPQPESYWGNVNPIGIRGAYDESKRFAEAMAMAYHRMHDVDIRIVRIFNTYGPRMRPDDGRVVTTFLRQAVAGEPITVFGDGSQTRSFCFVDDQVTGQLALLDSEVQGPVNIGNDAEITIRQLAELAIEITNSTSEIIELAAAADDPGRRRPDLTQARTKLGWEPTITLRDGLARTLASMTNETPS